MNAAGSRLFVARVEEACGCRLCATLLLHLAPAMWTSSIETSEAP